MLSECNGYATGAAAQPYVLALALVVLASRSDVNDPIERQENDRVDVEQRDVSACAFRGGLGGLGVHLESDLSVPRNLEFFSGHLLIRRFFFK